VVSVAHPYGRNLGFLDGMNEIYGVLNDAPYHEVCIDSGSISIHTVTALPERSALCEAVSAFIMQNQMSDLRVTASSVSVTISRHHVIRFLHHSGHGNAFMR
jgi:hypothetical protein